MASSVSSQIVLRINGREVKDTFNDLKRATTVLRQELQTLTPGTEEFVNKSKELSAAETRFARVREEIQQTRRVIQDTGTELKSFSDLGPYLAEKLSKGATESNFSLKSIGSGFKTMATEAWMAISSIPVAGWIAAGVGALAVGIKQVLDFNTELYEANKLTSDITKLQGDQLDKMTVRSQTMEELFKFDKKETLVAARNLVENFKIS